MAIQVFKGALAGLAQVRSPQFHQRLALERIKLQVHFAVWNGVVQAFHKVFVLRDTYPIGVYHQMPDGLLSRIFQNGEEVRVESRLAPEICQQSGWPSFRTTASIMRWIISRGRDPRPGALPA